MKFSSADPPLPPYFIDDPSGVSQIALDSINGTLWLVTADHLIAYNRAGKQVAVIALPKHLKPVEALSVDAFTHDVWVGTKKVLARLTSSGVLVAELAVSNELEALAIAPALPRPKLTLLEPLDQSLTNDPTPIIRYLTSGLCGETSCDPGSDYYQSLNLDIILNGYQIGAQFTVEGNIASFTPSVRVNEGQNILSASAADIYGNSSGETLNSSFEVDTLPPVFGEFTPEDGSVVTEDVITISGSVDDASAVIVLENLFELGGSVISTNSSAFSYSVPLAIGANSFTFTATDLAGNQTQAELTITRTIPLELEIINIEDGAVVSENLLTLSGNVTGLPGTTVKVNGIEVEVDENGNFSLENIPLNPGQNTITIVAISPDGQIVQKQITVFLSSSGYWETPVVISDINHTGSGYTPVATIDKKGNVLVVWSQHPGISFQPYDIVANRYVVGSGWETPTTIVQRADPYKMDIAMNQAGDAMLVWSDCARTGYCYLGSTHITYALRFDRNNGWDATSTRIDDGIRNTSDARPVVGLDQNGGVVALFIVNSNVFENRYTPALGWTGAADINIRFTGFQSGDFFVGKQGNAVFAWNRSSGSKYYARVRRYDPVAGWSPFDELYARTSGGNTYYEAPSVGVDANGHSMVIARDKDIVTLYRYIPGTGWQLGERLDNGSPAYYRANPNLALNDEGDFAVTWHTRADSSQMMIDEREFINGQWSNEKTLSTGGAYFQDPTFPAIALNDRGDAAAAWLQGSDPNKDVWANVKSNNSWGAAVPLEFLERGYPSPPSIVIDDNGIATVVWSQQAEQYGPQRVFASRFIPGASGGSAPVVTPPPDIELEATAVLTSVDIGQAIATDSIDGDLVATPDISGPFPVGPNFVTWSATNSQGVTRTAVQNVIITDTTPPVLTIPANVEINVTDPAQLPIAIDIGTATATDIFSPVTISSDAPSAFDPGTTIVKWTATDTNGVSTILEQTVKVNFDGDIFIRISDPVNGAFHDGNQLSVSGVFIGPANAGVTVNGVIASIYDGRFYADQIPYDSGDFVITAKGTTSTGVIVEDSITIQVQDKHDYWVNVEPNEGIAPLTTTFSIFAFSDAPTQKVYVDYNGDGVNDDVQVGENAKFNHTFTGPGIYKVKFTGHTIYGSVKEHIAIVVVQDPVQMDQIVAEIWDGMNTALIAGDVDTASKYLNKSATEKFVPVFNILLSDMQQIVDSYSPIRRISASKAFAEYALVRIQHGEKRLYLINFLKGFDGVWRLDSM